MLDFKTDAVIAVVLIVVLVLGYRLLNRDATVRRTRWGFFVERDRFNEEPDEPTDELPADEADTREWPTR